MATLGGAAAWPLISNIAESVFGTQTGLYGECLTLMASGENWTPDRLAEGEELESNILQGVAGARIARVG
jgi:hypothetical protein